MTEPFKRLTKEEMKSGAVWWTYLESAYQRIDELEKDRDQWQVAAHDFLVKQEALKARVSELEHELILIKRWSKSP